MIDDANAVEVPEVLEKSDDVEREPENGTELLLKNPELQALRQKQKSVVGFRRSSQRSSVTPQAARVAAVVQLLKRQGSWEEAASPSKSNFSLRDTPIEESFSIEDSVLGELESKTAPHTIPTQDLSIQAPAPTEPPDGPDSKFIHKEDTKVKQENKMVTVEANRSTSERNISKSSNPPPTSPNTSQIKSKPKPSTPKPSVVPSKLSGSPKLGLISAGITAQIMAAKSRALNNSSSTSSSKSIQSYFSGSSSESLTKKRTIEQISTGTDGPNKKVKTV